MRRREEGLGFWLAAAPNSSKATLLSRLRKIIRRRLKSGRLKCVVGDIPLAMEPCIYAGDVLNPGGLAIHDGLGYWAAGGGKGGGYPEEEALRAVHACELLSQAIARPLSLPGDLPIQVNSPTWIYPPHVRSLQRHPWEETVRVRAIACFRDLRPGRTFSRWLDPSRTTVRVATARIAAMPQAGHSSDLEEMKAVEKESFLREAAAIKGVAPEAGELLAVFRNVPIEVVSRLSYSQESRTIFYYLTLGPGVRRTRVHDIAAVLDKATREIHLVPHRTRYRTVFLN